MIVSKEEYKEAIIRCISSTTLSGRIDDLANAIDTLMDVRIAADGAPVIPRDLIQTFHAAFLAYDRWEDLNSDIQKLIDGRE